jgi:hypothetical protein
MKPVVLLDCDGPLADFSQGFLDSVEHVTGWKFTPDVITEFGITTCPFFEKLAEDLGMSRPELSKKVWRDVNRIGWCSALRPTPGSIEAVKELREHAHVEVVTSPLRSTATWMIERVEWLERFYGFDAEEIHFVSKKFRVVGDFLVDDKLDHIAQWSAGMASLRDDEVRGADYGRVPHALLWDMPYNQALTIEGSKGLAVRVRDWDTVVSLVKEWAR